MPNFNYQAKKIIVKIVYYGPGLGGKTTSLQYLYQQAHPDRRGEMYVLGAEGDQIMYFELLPFHRDEIKGFKLYFQVYTVPGQVKSNNTRKVALEGVDAIVFVADSQKSREKANLVSLGNLKQNLRTYNLRLEDLPVVFEYNKRDLRNILSVIDLNRELNPTNHSPYVEAIATKGKGVLNAFEITSNLVIRDLMGHLQDIHEESASESEHPSHILEFPGLEESLDFDVEEEFELMTTPQEKEEPRSYLDLLAVTYRSGEVIFEKGDPGDAMYFVVSGKVKIVTSYKATEKVLAVCQEGDFFGEMALFGENVRSARAIAVGTTHLVSVNREKLVSQIDKKPEIAMTLLDKLSDRLRNANQRYSKMAVQNKELKLTVVKAKKVIQHLKQQNIAKPKPGIPIKKPTLAKNVTPQPQKPGVVNQDKKTQTPLKKPTLAKNVTPQPQKPGLVNKDKNTPKPPQ